VRIFAISSAVMSPLAPDDGAPSPSDETDPVFSPDGKWVAYSSNESGTTEVYVRPFPAMNSGKWQVSTSGGSKPRWKQDGKELYYISIDNKLMAVTVNAGTTFELGTPRPLFEMPQATLVDDAVYDVAADGQRFLLCAPPGTKYFSSITVALNWRVNPKH
jgi:Tol biopolymer transport system component